MFVARSSVRPSVRAPARPPACLPVGWATAGARGAARRGAAARSTCLFGPPVWYLCARVSDLIAAAAAAAAAAAESIGRVQMLPAGAAPQTRLSNPFSFPAHAGAKRLLRVTAAWVKNMLLLLRRRRRRRRRGSGRKSKGIEGGNTTRRLSAGENSASDRQLTRNRRELDFSAWEGGAARRGGRVVSVPISKGWNGKHQCWVFSFGEFSVEVVGSRPRPRRRRSVGRSVDFRQSSAFRRWNLSAAGR